MTPARAALIALIALYTRFDEPVTRLEIQKLAYLLQEAGEPMKLEFRHGSFGPYSESLNHALQRLEGHFVRGYGDRTQPSALRLAPGAEDEAERFLFAYPETFARLARVAKLIEGFESPRGLELLATVHWLANHDPAVATDPQRAVFAVRQWNTRKKRVFPPAQIEAVWKRLAEAGWLAVTGQRVSV
jgi:hypothetical protein